MNATNREARPKVLKSSRMTVVDLVAKPLRPFWFRGKTRLLNGLCPRVGTRNFTLFGYNVELDLSDHIQRNVYLGTYEPHDSKLVSRYLSPGITFVDIGANFGYYSLMAAAAIGDSGRVFGFEPNPELCDHLRGTIQKNEIMNITVEQAGVSDEAGWADLFLPIKRGNNTATMIANAGGRPLRVPVVTLDEYLDRYKIARVDFLKIDVDGFEPRVIRGAQAAIRAKRIKAVFCDHNNVHQFAVRLRVLNRVYSSAHRVSSNREFGPSALKILSR
jgi:FkbM family methyltransferase